MDWTDMFYGSMIVTLIVGVTAVGFLIGSACGYLRGRHDVSSYYSSHRDEDAEIISRLRGRIIWLEASIKESQGLIEKAQMSEISVSSALTSASLKLQETKEVPERLERTEDDKCS